MSWQGSCWNENKSVTLLLWGANHHTTVQPEIIPTNTLTDVNVLIYKLLQNWCRYLVWYSLLCRGNPVLINVLEGIREWTSICIFLKCVTAACKSFILKKEYWKSSENHKRGNIRPQSETAVGVALDSSSLSDWGSWSQTTGIWSRKPYCASFEKPQSKQRTETATLIISINTPSYCYFCISMIYITVFPKAHQLSRSLIYTQINMNWIYLKGEEIYAYHLNFCCCFSLEWCTCTHICTQFSQAAGKPWDGWPRLDARFEGRRNHLHIKSEISEPTEGKTGKKNRNNSFFPRTEYVLYS